MDNCPIRFYMVVLSFLPILFSLQVLAVVKDPLDRFKLKNQDPQKDLQEIMGELEEKRNPSSLDEESTRLSLKKINKDSPSVVQVNLDTEKEQEEDSQPKMEIKREKSLVPKIQDTLFAKERVKRDLDIYLGNQDDLSLNEGEVKERLNEEMELRWEKSKEID